MFLNVSIFIDGLYIARETLCEIYLFATKTNTLWDMYNKKEKELDFMKYIVTTKRDILWNI